MPGQGMPQMQPIQQMQLQPQMPLQLQHAPLQTMPSIGLSQQGLQSLPPPVFVYLAPATKSLVPVSSKQNQNKQIAMQFLNADRETQTQMLRDPNVARAILQTLGESSPKGAPAPAVSAVLSSPAVPVPAAPTVGSSGAEGASLAWSGKMTLARSMGKQMTIQATLLHGKVQAVELALRIAAQNSGILNISHRVPFDDLARRTPGAILAFAPVTPHEQGQYDEYAKYFQKKMRAGVARLDDSEAMYLVPPCAEAEVLLSALQAGGAPQLPKHCLLGIIAATPGPTGNAPPVGAPMRAAPVLPAKEPPPGREAKAEPPEEPTRAEAPREADAGDSKGTADDKDGGEMSQEALLDLFSNPELIKSLQGVEDSTND